jgi:hypothetical protein
MLEPQVAATTVDQTMNQVHVAEQISDPTHVVTGQGPDGRAAGSSLGGIVPPRATGGRDLSAEGGSLPVTTDHNGADGRVTFGSPVAHSSDKEEAGLRATIAMHTLQLNALTTTGARQRGTSGPGPSTSTVDRSGPSTSILRNGLREIPPRRTTAAILVPDYPHILKKDLNVAGIYAMAKVNKTYSKP